MYQKVSVLIIEDEKSICDFMNKTLTAAGTQTINDIKNVKLRARYDNCDKNLHL